MIVTVTLNPCVDRTLHVKSINLNEDNRANYSEVTPGGKGINASRIIKSLGGYTKALVVLGKESGIEIENMLVKEEVPYVKVKIADRSREIITIHEEEKNKYTAFFEPGPSIADAERKNILKKYEELVSQANYIVLGGALQNETLSNIYYEMVAIANNHNVKVVLDSHGEGLKDGLKASPFMIKPNHQEASQILGRPILSFDDIVEVSKMVFSQGVKVLILSNLNSRSKYHIQY